MARPESPEKLTIDYANTGNRPSAETISGGAEDALAALREAEAERKTLERGQTPAVWNRAMSINYLDSAVLQHTGDSLRLDMIATATGVYDDAVEASGDRTAIISVAFDCRLNGRDKAESFKFDDIELEYYCDLT